jgi:hypothetical protein
MIFEKKDDILNDSFVTGARAVPDKWRRCSQAGQADMRLSRPFKKPAAGRAKGQRAGPQFFPAALADGPLGWAFEKGTANLAPGWIKQGFGGYHPGFEPAAERLAQPPDSSVFC